uniref:Uncharacterized protein n=1 Tax=Oryza sativa subsp. japonica TaxID=39947 RepID=Q67UF8_ORYSJ|nr:hypothetical protein [Oryza sativa Japonica Group]
MEGVALFKSSGGLRFIFCTNGKGQQKGNGAAAAVARGAAAVPPAHRGRRICGGGCSLLLQWEDLWRRLLAVAAARREERWRRLLAPLGAERGVLAAAAHRRWARRGARGAGAWRRKSRRVAQLAAGRDAAQELGAAGARRRPTQREGHDQRRGEKEAVERRP